MPFWPFLMVNKVFCAFSKILIKITFVCLLFIKQKLKKNVKKIFFFGFYFKTQKCFIWGVNKFFYNFFKKVFRIFENEMSTLHPSVHISILQYEHCDKSRGDVRAVPRSAAGTKWYITEVF